MPTSWLRPCSLCRGCRGVRYQCPWASRRSRKSCLGLCGKWKKHTLELCTCTRQQKRHDAGQGAKLCAVNVVICKSRIPLRTKTDGSLHVQCMQAAWQEDIGARVVDGHGGSEAEWPRGEWIDGKKDLLGLSNMRVRVSPWSSALRVMTSSFPAHLSTLVMLARLRPSDRQRSHL